MEQKILFHAGVFLKKVQQQQVRALLENLRFMVLILRSILSPHQVRYRLTTFWLTTGRLIKNTE